MSYTTSDLLRDLRAEISPEEEIKLRSGEGLVISDFNRGNVLEMLEFTPGRETEVDRSAVTDLRTTLDAYLGKYLADKPEGWKWIFISCAYLSFVKRVPMHQIERADVERVETDGEVIYKCPYREDTPESTCRFCVCVKKDV